MHPYLYTYIYIYICLERRLVADERVANALQALAQSCPAASLMYVCIYINVERERDIDR